MKKSIFKGHPIKGWDSKSFYGSKNNLDVSGLLEATAAKLEKYGITDWEQLYALLKNDAIKSSLKDVLNISDDADLLNLQSVCENLLPDSKLKQLNETDFSNCTLGARKPKNIEQFEEKFVPINYTELGQLFEISQKLNEVRSFDLMPSFTFANSINHIQRLNAIRAQGNERGTCTSFAVTAANEFAIYNKSGQKLDLSEQHLFFETKILEMDQECGSWVRNAMQIISNKGQCREGVWSYNPNPPCVQGYGKPSNADNDAINFRSTFFSIRQNDVGALRQVLSSGRIIPFSIPVFDSWYRSAETYRTGRITMPLINEAENGGHSMVLVGYQDDMRFPGGGFFLIRNSWGIDWARDSFYGPGYGIIPYAYIQYYAWEAYAF